jgi:hypothetical protein
MPAPASTAPATTAPATTVSATTVSATTVSATTGDTSRAAEITSLEELATEADALGLCAAVRQPAGHPPYLHIRNPEAHVLTEKVFVLDGKYQFSWAEPIAGCDQPGTAAAILARVLRTVDGARA